MLLATLLALQTSPAIHHGRDGSLSVQPPRLAASARVDGILDEPVWRQAALLTGFSQYRPVDSRPAVDSTAVLVWYAPDAIWFGVRAWEPHGTVRATLADRDNIDGDDYVQILLDTFNDRRRALVIGVNPLGVQADGIRVEASPGAASGPGAGGRFENVDLNPDFQYESRGRVTAWGYEVEIRIPFKSIRYQTADPQTWAINVIRKIQHSGYEDTWTPAVRANASFLTQSGTLEGLTDLRRGLVLDLNPFATGRALGARDATGTWAYDATPEIGLNATWGVTTNLTLDATINPDFSQIEADVGQVTVNERFAVFFPEKRPFFLEGIEQFATPNSLIYTRRIRNPLGGAKLTGKVGGTTIAVLSVLDDETASATGADHPIVSAARIRRDLGGNSSAGFTYTDRVDGGNWNRVASLDTRIVFGRMYYVEAQVAGSATHTDGGSTTTAPLWAATFDRTGRNWGFHYSVTGIHPEFQAQAGFVNRTDVVNGRAFNRLTAYGAPGALVENWTGFFGIEPLWAWDDFFGGTTPIELSIGHTTFLTLRGGWGATVSPSWQSIAFDPDFFDDYAVDRGADTVAFVTPDRLSNLVGVDAGVSTPRFAGFSASFGGGFGEVPGFFEGARVRSRRVNASVEWRPTDQIRVDARYMYSALNRERDGSRLSTANIPRLKLEYQLSRPLFVRFVGQYNAQERDALRDPRTDQPLLIADGAGGYASMSATATNDLRVDWLVSFRPNPGTVLFAGYGSSLTEADAFAFQQVTRVQDGFFVKLSYLFRL
ncbi:MAG: DUF5916 domain-containing protein [Gemmatimonadales bacterium]